MPHRAREGDLYKEIRVQNKIFLIYYGYYDEIERQSKYNDPLPIYPDFLKKPAYTSEGYPFVTGMQEVCDCYVGRSAEDGCHGCAYYEEGDDLIGLCKHEKNRQKP